MDLKKRLCRKYIALLMFLTVGTSLFADIFVSLEQFKKFKNNSSMQKISAREMYADYKANSVQFELNYKEKAFIVTGRISKIRKGFFGEYIVELPVSNGTYGVSVVYPDSISEAKKQDLAALSLGEYFEALVAGRSTYAYVDVICYRINGKTRTEL
jgi:hypothetical protein